MKKTVVRVAKGNVTQRSLERERVPQPTQRQNQTPHADAFVSTPSHAKPPAENGDVRVGKKPRAGEWILNEPIEFEKSFATLRQERPEGTLNLLDFLDESELSSLARHRIASLQERLNALQQELEAKQLLVASKQMEKEAGYSNKVILELPKKDGTHSRFLHKPMDEVRASRIEFVVTLANLLGVNTPVVVKHRFTVEGEKEQNRSGTTTKLVPNVVQDKSWQASNASELQLQGLFVQRWFDELVGNLDCWWGQFLFPEHPELRSIDLIHIDFDEAFSRMPKETLFRALTEHFGLTGFGLEACVWRDQNFDFERRVGWSEKHYDSSYTVYGPLLKAYVLGEVDVNLDEVKAQLQKVTELPDQVFVNAMQSFLDASEAELGEPSVILPAAEGSKWSREEFQQKMLFRIRRSVGEYVEFLDELKAARTQASHPVHQQLSKMAPPAY